jgi:hypothetical protein
MNLSDIGTLIGSVGFPIVACCGMGWYINNTMQKFTDTMQKNTTALEKLLTVLRKDETNDGKDE